MEKMKKCNVKGQKGAISVFVVMAMLFFLFTILGVYAISSKRAQTQTESLKMSKKYYSQDVDTVYQSKVAGEGETIPIYTKEQLWEMGTGKVIEIEGKIYTFSNNANYELKNDIIINISKSETLNLVDESKIKKKDYEIYYYYPEDGNYYELANGATPDITIGTVGLVNKNNLSKNLGYVTNGLLLHYDGIQNTRTKHDGNATKWMDLSGNGNDGILNGCTWEDKSLNFDGKDDNVIVKESPTISPETQTIEIVLKSNGNSLNSSDGRQIFFVKWYGYTMELNANNTISYGRSTTSGYLKSINSIQQGKITSISATNGNNISTLYLNNTKENQASAVPVAYSGMKDLNIGCYNNAFCFNGNIYAIRMYNRVLSEAELAQNYEIDQARFHYVTDGLVLHYDGINNSGAGHNANATKWKDLSGNGNDGILTGFNNTEESGWKSDGLKFDGVDDIVKTNGNFDFSTFKSGTPFSYGATVKVKDVSGSWYGVMSNMNTWGNGGFNIQYGTAQKIAIGSETYLNSTTLPVANTTYNIYGVYDGSTMNLYVNGKLENSVAYTIKPGSKAMTLGWFYDLPSLPMNGEILNVKIYNKALTSDEVKANYEIDKERFHIPVYGTSIASNYPNLYSSFDTKNPIEKKAGSFDTDSYGNSNCAWSFWSTYVNGRCPILTSGTVNNYLVPITAGTNINTFSQTVQNNWINIWFRAGGATNQVYLNQLKLLFSDNKSLTINEAVASHYIQPLVIYSSGWNATSSHVWKNIGNIISGGQTDTSDYPQAMIMLKVMDKSSLKGISFNTNKAWTAPNDGFVVRLMENIELSTEPF